MENGNDQSSSFSFNSSSYLSNGCCSPSVNEPVDGSELLSLTNLRSSLEKLLLNSEYEYSDVEIVVEGVPVGVNRCILAARSQFFHDLFKKTSKSLSGAEEGNPKYLLSDLIPDGRVGYEAFLVLLHFLYTGKFKESPPEVSTCVDSFCAHDACGPSINYAVELLYGSAKFQMKELVVLIQRRLLNFIEKAFVEDVIPIVMVAFRCQLSQLLSHSVHRIARSDLDDITLEKELPHGVLEDIKSLRNKSKIDSDFYMEVDPLHKKSIQRILKALDSDDVELLGLLLDESNVTLDDACALHYAAAYCNPKIINEVLSMGKADVNLKNARGFTVLHVAARRKDPSVIVALLNNGASVLESSANGETAVTICRRLTRPKDYNEDTRQGKETNKDKLCIDVLEREMRRNPMTGNVSISSATEADDLIMRLLFLENRVNLAQMLFPGEAKVAMQIADANSTKAFAGLSSLKGSSRSLRDVDLNEIPSEQVKKLQLRLQALQKTVETGRRFFPNCSKILDDLLEDEMLDSLLLEKTNPEEQRGKKMRYMEIKEEVLKAFYKDKAENNWTGFTTASSSTSSPREGANHKARKKSFVQVT